MPSPTNINKYRAWIKDAILIIGFIATTAGWISSAASNRTEMKGEIRHLSNIVQDQNKQLEKINDILLEQKELNGKVIQFLESQ